MDVPGRSGALSRAVAPVIALAAVLMAGCSSSPPGPSVLACQHFKAQGEKFSALAAPTLADDAQAVAWVREDAALAADPALRRDLNRWVTDFNALIRGQAPTGNPKTAIIADCARLGVPGA